MTTPSNEQPPLTKEETAWLMRALWGALQAPPWDAGNRKDLQKLGEAIISGKSLKELPNDLLERIFPHLKTVTLHLGAALKAKAYEEDATTSTATTTAPPSQPIPVPVESPPQASRLSVVPTANSAEKTETAHETNEAAAAEKA
jgi:hypothetical protein